jgi:hypothetical protein
VDEDARPGREHDEDPEGDHPGVAEDERQRDEVRPDDDNQTRKGALFTAIRRDAAAGLSGRALERKHNVGRRTVVKALASASPPERKKPNRPPTIHGLHHHIDAMIENNPAVRANEVWAHLVDHHDTTVSYGAIRAYVTKRKAERDCGSVGGNRAQMSASFDRADRPVLMIDVGEK